MIYLSFLLASHNEENKEKLQGFFSFLLQRKKNLESRKGKKWLAMQLMKREREDSESTGPPARHGLSHKWIKLIMEINATV